MSARRFRTLFSISLAVMDSAMLSLAFVLAYRLRRDIEWPAEAVEMEPLAGYVGVWLIFVGATLLVFFLLRLYHLSRATSLVDEFYALFGGVSLGVLLGVAVAALTLKNSVFEANLPRVMIAYDWLAGLGLTALGRAALQTIRNVLRGRGGAQDKVLIIGTDEATDLILQKIQGSPFLGYQVLGLINEDGAPEAVRGVPVVGGVADLSRLIDELSVDEVIIALPDAPDDELIYLIGLCHRERVSLKVFPNLYDIMT
nr:hypothetical protein [Anaerolineales bacterium]